MNEQSSKAYLCINGPQAGLMVGQADIAPSGYLIEGPDTFTFYSDPYFVGLGGQVTLAYPARYVFYERTR